MVDPIKPKRHWSSAPCLVLGSLGLLADAVLVALGYLAVDRGWLVMAASGALLLASQLDRITELSVAGVSAKLQQTLAEANATLDEAKRLFSVLADAILTDLMAADFAGNMGTRSRFDLRDEVVRSLVEAKLSPEQIDRADRGWRRGMGIIFARIIGALVKDRLDTSERDRGAKDAISRTLESYYNIDDWSVASPQKYRELLKEKELWDAELEMWLQDYELFLQTGQIRRREDFLYLAYERSRERRRR